MLPRRHRRRASAACIMACINVFIEQTIMKQDPRFPNLFITDHPLIQHKLSHMRAKDTSTRTFRDLLKEITLLMGYEITRDLPLTTRTVETPLMTIDAPVIAGRKLAIVTILRAGSGKSDGLLDMVPTALVGHIRVFRANHFPVAGGGAGRRGSVPEIAPGREAVLRLARFAPGRPCLHHPGPGRCR